MVAWWCLEGGTPVAEETLRGGVVVDTCQVEGYGSIAQWGFNVMIGQV